MMRRNKDGDLVGFSGRARSPRGNRLSKSTLYKLFVTMMAMVFVAYCILMVMLVRSHHNTTIRAGNWGPSIANSGTIFREHLAQQQQQRDDERRNKSRIRPETSPIKGSSSVNEVRGLLPKAPKDVTIDSEANLMRGASKDLEEPDIHDMKRPEEIQKAKQPPPPIVVEVVDSSPDPKLKAVAANASSDQPGTEQQQQQRRVLKAYLERTNFGDWETKPLPVRTTTADQLTVVEYPRLNSCRRLPELFPINDYPDADPFLPWIHDVFPTDDGQYIQFVAQNKRRCRTGTTPDETASLEHMQPQIALFQHVPVKRLKQQQQQHNQTRYQLTDHPQADPDGMETRFICQFHPSGQETLSVFNINYDYAAKRKGNVKTFSKEGIKDNKSIHTSQLLFRCPVPADLMETVREGTSVVNDQATMFVTLVPIRTPPRYGAPGRFLPPYYQDSNHNNFSVAEEWGSDHVLPRIEDSGRWENIPICLPTYKAYPDATAAPPPVQDQNTRKARTPTEILYPPSNLKKHRLIAGTWASTQYATRGDRFAISDGARRLDEWIRFHLLVGVDHIFIYDNSPGGTSTTTLQTVTDQFPNQVTRIPWPATICNNNRSFEDSPGERSSQYAAESAWRLRFGPHTDWMASMDIDEYMVPVGEHTSLKPFLDGLDQNGTKIISFGSWRAWPRRDMIKPPVPIQNKTICDQPHPCFEVHIPSNRSILQTYNCDRQLVKKESMPAEKQIYRPDYVMQHYVHYSTVTRLAQMNPADTVEAGFKYGRVSPDPLSRFADEMNEVTMLHTKALATQDTAGWQTRCKGELKGSCRIGVSWPDTTDASTNLTKDAHGWLYNCHVNQRIEEYWAPRLDQELLKQSKLVEIER
jgi:hypothetical protein